MKFQTCGECQSFFAHQEDIGKPYHGICLADGAFEPYLDEILEDFNYSNCEDLVNDKQIPDDREACDKFEIVEEVGIDENSEIGKSLAVLRRGGRKLDAEKVRQAVLINAFEDVDWANAPVDEHVKNLSSSCSEDRKTAISTLGFLIGRQNKNAFQALLEYLKKTPPPRVIEDIHFRIDLFENLLRGENRNKLIQVAVDELYKAPSNQTTRQWITFLFEFLKKSDINQTREPLEKMLKSDHFSYKLKKKIDNILSVEDDLSFGTYRMF